jgi:capsid protein
MATVTLNLQVDDYSNQMLDVVKAVWGLGNKSEAVNFIIHKAAPEIIEPAVREEFARKVMRNTAEWERKFNFTRKTTNEELDELLTTGKIRKRKVAGPVENPQKDE